MSKAWYILRTKPQSDHLAARNLVRQSFEIFFPKVGVPKPGARQSMIPLFPGYLFINLDSDDNLWPVVTLIPGVMGWLRVEGVVPTVPDDVVQELVERVQVIDSGGGLFTRFRPGQTVRVVSGKLEGLARVMEAPRSPESRVRVLLDFMGRQVLSEVPWHSIKAIDSESGPTIRGRRPRRTRGKGRWIRGFGPAPALGT
jgi:transcriptional antiterminator RfaH